MKIIRDNIENDDGEEKEEKDNDVEDGDGKVEEDDDSENNDVKEEEIDNNMEEAAEGNPY